MFALDFGVFRAEGGVRGLADVEASGPPGGGLMAFAKPNSSLPNTSASAWTCGPTVLALLVPDMLPVSPGVASLLFPRSPDVGASVGNLRLSRFTEVLASVGALLFPRSPLKSGHFTLLFLHCSHARPGSLMQGRPCLMQRGHASTALGASVGGFAFARFTGRSSGSCLASLDSAPCEACCVLSRSSILLFGPEFPFLFPVCFGASASPWSSSPSISFAVSAGFGLRLREGPGRSKVVASPL